MGYLHIVVQIGGMAMHFKILDASFHVSMNGDMMITGVSEKGYSVTIKITKDNPVTFVEVTNTYFCFKVASKKTIYCIYFSEIDARTAGVPTRKLQWTGADKKAPTNIMFFLHDLIAEVLYYCYMQRYFNVNANLEVEYLKDRYKDCDKYISELDFEVIVSQLIEHINLAHGVDEDGCPLF